MFWNGQVSPKDWGLSGEQNHGSTDRDSMNKQTHRAITGPTMTPPHDQTDQAAIGSDSLSNGGVIFSVFTQAFEKKARLAYPY